jgi:predicted O-methyltransferase YrrM
MRVVLEYAYWESVVTGLAKPKIPIISYVPARRRESARMLPIQSAWKGIESILSDIIERFQIKTDRCLEFGVERGYSTAALSSYFNSILGVDTFLGDKHTRLNEDFFEETARNLSSFDNIRLVRSDYRDWIKQDNSYYDLIHIDIIHTYADTFACGVWSAEHAKCVIFHDTESFPEVKEAVREICRKTGKNFYNFTESYGLGIIV